MAHLKNIVIVVAGTLGSRVLGLVRDMLAAAFFAVGVFNSAFNFAFTLPNMFRRMLGEGALSSALVPVLNDARIQEGERGAWEFLNQTLTRAALLLLALVLLMCALVFALMAGIPNLQERWQLGFEYALVLMPYMFLVCIAAVQAAALNVFKRFGVTSFSQVWLNLSMIFFLGVLGYLFGKDASEQMHYQCAGVLFGGLLQVAVPFWALWRLGWRPRFDLRFSPRVKELYALFLPGLFGAAILQINVVVSRFLAMAINDSAVTVLYLTSRLVELPLGLFAASAATVIFPALSECASRGDRAGFAVSYARGLRLIWAMTIPAALGLIVLSEPIIDLLFRRGHFDGQAVALTAPVLAIAALGLPFYALAIFATRGAHALKDMKTPMRLAAVAFVLNFSFSLLLMFPFGTEGLAAANVLAVAVQSALLQRVLRRNQKESAVFADMKLGASFFKILGASLAMAGVVWGLWNMYLFMGLHGKAADWTAVCTLIPLGGAFYFILLQRLNFEDNALLRAAFQKIFQGLRKNGKK